MLKGQFDYIVKMTYLFLSMLYKKIFSKRANKHIFYIYIYLLLLGLNERFLKMKTKQ